MLRTFSAFIGTFVALFLLVGLQTRSSAQSAFSISWATSGSSTLLVNVNITTDSLGKPCGPFGFSCTGFTTKCGTATSMANSLDAAGNYLSTVIGSVRYYTVINGVQSTTSIAATATLKLSKLADGTSSESLTIVDANNTVLFTTGSLWALSRGSISITL